MRIRRFVCVAFACAAVLSRMVVNAGAVDERHVEMQIARATGEFRMEIAGNTLATANSTFPLEAGESVEINAVYSPKSASVDFGVVAPDGLFYPPRGANGAFHKSIKVDVRGNYTLAIRNNSSETVKVSGFVNY